MGRRGQIGWACGALLALALPTVARAGFWWRDSLTSAWTLSPLRMEGDDRDWPERGAFEDGGLSVQAMNDGSDLYLKITASTREGRAQLTGIARQDVALWFFGADGKTRRWGVRMPFSRMSPPDEDELRYGPAASDDGGQRPELVSIAAVPASTGTVVSTAAWPTDMGFRLAFAGRRPVWKLRLPLGRLTPDKSRACPLDFVVSGKAARLRSVPRPAPPSAPEADGRHGRSPAGQGPRGDSGPPEPVDFNLLLRLAADPAQAQP